MRQYIAIIAVLAISFSALTGCNESGAGDTSAIISETENTAAEASATDQVSEVSGSVITLSFWNRNMVGTPKGGMPDSSTLDFIFD